MQDLITKLHLSFIEFKNDTFIKINADELSRSMKYKLTSETIKLVKYLKSNDIKFFEDKNGNFVLC